MHKSINTESTQKMIDKMLSGDKEAVLYGITSGIAIVQLNAVIEGVKMNIRDKDFIKNLRNLKNTKEKFFGNPFSDFVLAALDILEVEKYTGSDEMINRLIESQFNF